MTLKQKIIVGDFCELNWNILSLPVHDCVPQDSDSSIISLQSAGKSADAPR